MSIYEIYCLVGFICFMILTCVFILVLFFDYLKDEREKRNRCIEREEQRISLIKEVVELQTEHFYLVKRIESLESMCDNEN